MNKFILAAILAAGLVVPVAAQGTVIDAKGTLGLQFSAGGNGSLGVNGLGVTLPGATAYGIGGKYFVADKYGLSLALFIAGDNDSAADIQNFLFGLRPSLSYTLVKKGPVALYTGGYLGLGIEKTTDTGTSTSSNVLALGGGIGAEWAIADQVTIAAEYNIGIALYDGYTYWGNSGTRAYLTFYF
jgi:opacity protein-like surface antigen